MNHLHDVFEWAETALIGFLIIVVYLLEGVHQRQRQTNQDQERIAKEVHEQAQFIIENQHQLIMDCQQALREKDKTIDHLESQLRAIKEPRYN